jgi:predicted dehydrogenase
MSLRVGLVGYGDIAHYHARHLAAAGAEVAGAVTRRPLPRGLTRYPTLSAMLGDVDAVTIAVPNHLHASLCEEAVKAGVAVFVEKPLCINDDELLALEACLARSLKPVHVGFRLRWNPSLMALRMRLKEVRRVRCVYRMGIERLAEGKTWTRHERESGGAFFALGVHALDLARWLARADGKPLGHLRAEATHRGAAADFPLVVGVSGVIRGGARIEAGADLRGDSEFRLEVQIDATNGRFATDALAGLRPEDAGAADAEYGAMLRHFVEAAVQANVSRADITEILQSHRELLAARRVAGAGT